MPAVTAAMVAAGRVVGEPRLAPDGSVLAFVASSGGRAALTVVPAGGGAETVLTSDPLPCSARADGGGVFDWRPDGSGLVYAAVDGTLWLQPVTGGPPRPVTTAHADGAAAAPAVSPDGTRVAYVVDQRHVAVASLGPHGPWPVRLTTTADFAFDPTWSPDGTLVAWHEWDVPAMPWDASRIAIRRADGTGDVEVVAGGAGTAVAQPRFGPDGRLGFLCDAATAGDDADRWLNLWVADPDGTGARPLVTEPTEHGGPAWGQGVRTWCWSPDGSHVAWRTNDDGYSRLLVASAIDPDWRWVVGKGVHHALSWAGSRLAAVRTGARTPTQLVTYDAAAMLAGLPDRRDDAIARAQATVTRSAPDDADPERIAETAAEAARQLGIAGQIAVKVDRTTVARGPIAGWEALDLPEPEVIRWAGGDGHQVVGRLYRPDGATDAPPPLLTWIHGGPTDQWLVTFNARHAYFLSQGWAILVPDHRGSTGHGRAYTQAMAGRWGELDVSDCAAGMRQVADRGLVDPTRMVPMGSSAGGFTALLLLAQHPELCAAGVALSAVADLLDLAERSHRFEAHYTHSLIGPLPATRDVHVARSPLSRADDITTPLLLLHGDADPVVPVDQARALAAKLQRLGRDVDLHVYEGQGHGWGRADIVIDELQRIDAFLAHHVP